MKNLILYGSQNLSNKKFGVADAPGADGHLANIQKIDNARFTGSTIVDKKISDKEILLRGTMRATDNLTLRDVSGEYSRAFNKADRYFRISRNYHVFTPMEDYVGWQMQGDATEISFDEEVFQYGDGSVKFDADISEGNSYTGIYTLSAEEMDLAYYDSAGAFEMWIYFPQTSGLSNVELIIGNDDSNYFSDTVTEQYDETPFEVGWNFLSYDITSMDTTGTIDPYNFGEYVSIKANYTGDMADRDSFRIGGVIWQDEDESSNYRAYISDFQPEKNHYDITRTRYTLGVLAYEGVAESTGSFNVLGLRDQTSATASGEIELEGTYNPLPVMTVDVKSATNLSGITLTNITTGDSIDITRTYAAGETLIIDTDGREVTVDGDNVDYEDVLPRFVLGENDLQFSLQTTSEEDLEYTTQDTNLTGEV